MNIAIFASGAGSTFKSLLDSLDIQKLPLRFVVLITDNLNSGAIEVAKANGIKYQCLPLKKTDDFFAWDLALCQELEKHHIDQILLLGFLKKIGPNLLKKYKGRIVNTHPSLLPKFGGAGMYGRRVHEAVISAGDRESGITIHEVSEEYDRGRILKQKSVPVKNDDTPDVLQSRIQAEEKLLLIEYLKNLS